MSRAEDINKLFEEANDQFSSVDILVNNAGGPPPGYFMDMTDADRQTAHEPASLVVYLASGHAAYMTGTTIQVDGGLIAGYS